MEKPEGASKAWSKELEDEFLGQPIETLIDDPYFLGRKEDLYPAHREDILELFERKDAGESLYVFLDTEAIGAGKTYKAAVILWILIYRLLCRNRPQEYLGLDRDSVLSYICMSRDDKKAKKVTFTKVLPFFDCDFFNDYFPPVVGFRLLREYAQGTRKFYPSEIRFPKNIVLFPGTGQAASALGYDLLGGIVDETNYLEYVERSKRSMGEQEHLYDAAEDMFRHVVSRIESRFMFGGKLPVECLLTMISSHRYKNDFLDRKIKECKEGKNRNAMWRWRSLWEAKPKVHKGREIWSGKTFSFSTERMEVIEDELAMEVVG